LDAALPLKINKKRSEKPVTLKDERKTCVVGQNVEGKERRIPGTRKGGGVENG
jgi:hypothetical protein